VNSEPIEPTRELTAADISVLDLSDELRITRELLRNEHENCAILCRWSESGTRIERPVAVAYTVAELAQHVFPPRRALLTRCGDPVPREGHLAEVYAEPGVGKTWFTLSLALAAASGTEVLGFSAPAPARVLVIDGEMASEDVQGRVVLLCEFLKIPYQDVALTVVAADCNWTSSHDSTRRKVRGLSKRSSIRPT
jgi:hypothetical protein